MYLNKKKNSIARIDALCCVMRFLFIHYRLSFFLLCVSFFPFLLVIVIGYFLSMNVLAVVLYSIYVIKMSENIFSTFFFYLQIFAQMNWVEYMYYIRTNLVEAHSHTHTLNECIKHAQ